VAALGFPSTSVPTGWFVVSWSHDLPVGGVKPLEYFGEKLVLWRGESGEVFLQDAFCLHLGAHRGIGGFVAGDDITCPWHGWQWNGEGRNTVIPYGDDGCKPKLAVRTYPTTEWCGAVVAWYEPNGGEPTWDLPVIENYGNPDWFDMHPFSSKVHRIRAHPQMPIENAVDPAHIPLIHGASEVPRILATTATGHHFRSEVEVLYGGGRESTAITPNGAAYASVDMNTYGIGLSIVYWDAPMIPTVQITGFTPVDGDHIDYWFAQSSQRPEGESGTEPTGAALKMLKVQWKVIEQDFFIWENMKYLDRPNFASLESKHYASMRRWATQFYPEADRAVMVPDAV
jgi:phenylpropionate dioxygenase-like ring-hydroxylating dioxygenase large terminal subunit